MLIDESHNGKTVDIAIGDTIEIRLPENASTGFRWNVTSRCESILAMTNDRREPPASSARGAPGQHHWQLQATAAGVWIDSGNRKKTPCADRPRKARPSVRAR